MHALLLHIQCCVCDLCAADDDTRLMRRIKRDVAERGRDVMNVLEQYQKFVKPAFDQFVAPSRR